MKHPLILVTGAIGYIGGRLVPRLLNDGYRAMARSREKIQGKPWKNHQQETYAQWAGLKKSLFISFPASPLGPGTKIAHAVTKSLLPMSPGISQPLLKGLGVETIFGGMLNELAGRVGKKILKGPEKYQPGPPVLDTGDTN
jgi:hypothetical protein